MARVTYRPDVGKRRQAELPGWVMPDSGEAARDWLRFLVDRGIATPVRLNSVLWQITQGKQLIVFYNNGAGLIVNVGSVDEKWWIENLP